MFVELTLEMQNSKCNVQNCGISCGNDFNLSAKPTQSFCILRVAAIAATRTLEAVAAKQLTEIFVKAEI